MARSFPISDLRTLAARALQAGDYTPSGSARVRAVPDTRTIRYYTTLGLIDRPAEMRGRTAFYTDRHVLQVVAIKRLQASGLSLSEIQETLVGVTKPKLRRIADLPDGFWNGVDDYLARPKPTEKRSSRETATAEPAAPAPTQRRDDFWSVAAAIPDAAALATVPPSLSQCLRVSIHPGVELSIELPPDSNNSGVDLGRIQTAARQLIGELSRQGLVPDSPSISSSETP